MRLFDAMANILFFLRQDKKFQVKKQAGGGVYITATIKIGGPQEFETVECENGEIMAVEN